VHESSFGKQIFILGATLSGHIPQEDWRQFLPAILAIAGLNKSHEGHTYNYPNDLGFIHMQPIISSFVVLDAWPAHNGAYLHICSCKEFNSYDMLTLLGIKYKVLDSFQKEMKLP